MAPKKTSKPKEVAQAELADSGTEEPREPAETGSGTEETKPEAKKKARSKRGPAKPKPNAKAGLSCGAWATFQPEEEDPSDGEVEEVIPANLPKKVRFELGKKPDGTSLPLDDTTPYTPKQIFVLKKVIKDLPEKAQAFEEVLATRDKSVIRAFVNAHVPKDASYAWCLSSVPAAETFRQEAVGFQKSNRSWELECVSYTEALGKCGGKEEVLEQGLKRGDVRVDRDGFYCFKKRRHTVDNGFEERAGTLSAQDMAEEDAAELRRHMKHEVNWGAALMEDDVPQTEPQPASQKAMAALQDAYENMNQSMNFIKKLARELGLRSAAHADLIKTTLRMCCTVASSIATLDLIMVRPPESLTDTDIKTNLRGAQAALSPLLRQGAEISDILTEFKKAEKRDKRGSAKPMALTDQ